MPPLNDITTWERFTDTGEEVQPKSRLYLLYEGSNTEEFYFSKLLVHLNRLGLPRYVAVERCVRTGDDETASNPKRLLKLAKDEILESESFLEGDEIAIVFDTDVYAHKEDEYEDLLRRYAEEGVQPYVTFPSFELFLLLHLHDGYEKWVLPNESEIIQNRKVKGRRYVERLFSEASGMNPKTNEKVGDLEKLHELACEEEKQLNQEAEKAIGRLTSNVGLLIQKLKSS